MSPLTFFPLQITLLDTGDTDEEDVMVADKGLLGREEFNFERSLLW